MREFSDEARDKLYAIIDDINDKQWCGFTDWMGDRWSTFQEWIGVLGIEEYGSNVDKYHGIIVDKNNTSKSEIDKIYKDVENVDIFYKTTFEQLVETVKGQIAFIDSLAEAINPSKGIASANVALINLPNLVEEPNLNLIYSYVERIRNGNGDGDYDYDYIREIMEMNLDEVSDYMYAALIIVFKEMDDEQKAKFVENSYFCTEEFWADPSGNGAGTFEYRISDVFQQMVGWYGSALEANITSNILFDKSNPNYEIAIENLLAYNTLCVFAIDYQSIYVPGMNAIFNSDNITDLDIKIETVQTDPVRTDYKITVGGSNSPYSEMAIPMCSTGETVVNVYEYRSNLERLLDESVIRTLETMKSDIGENIASSAFDGVTGVVLGFVDIGKTGGTALTISQGFMDGIQSYVEVVKMNSKVEGMQETLSIGNILSVIGAGGTMYMDSEGNYQITSLMIDPEILRSNLNAYNQKHENFEISYEELYKAFENKNFEILGDDFNAFVEWCGDEASAAKNYN